MNGFKRFCLIVFGLAGLLSLAVFALPAFFGLYEKEIAAIAVDPIGGRVILCLVGITAVGLAVCLLRGIFTPRNRKSVIISSEGGDEIQVTRDAIKAQAVHVIECDGTMTARSVAVKAKKRGHIRVFARVQPQTPINVVDAGATLHADLVRGLADICGDKVESVDIEFLDAVTHEEPQSFDELEASYASARATVPAASVPAVEEHASDDITVPMGTSSWHPLEVAQTAPEVPEPQVTLDEPTPEPADGEEQ